MTPPAKIKTYTLDFESSIDYDLIGICSHHNDYRLAWGINSDLQFHLAQSAEPFYVTITKKGITVHQPHSMFEYYEEENRVNYYLIKNKEEGKYLIPERPSIDYFLFIHRNGLIDAENLSERLRSVNSILAVFNLNPEDFPSASNIIF